MATSFNPFTGGFDSGDAHTGSSSGIASPDSKPRTTPTDSSEFRHRNEGRWVGSSELARGEGIERTVRSPGGFPVINRGYQGTDLVKLPQGGQMTLDMAAQLGFANRNPDGTFSFSSGAGSDRENAPEGQQQGQPSGDPQEAPNEAETFRASDSAKEAMTSLVSTLAPSTQMAALNAVVETGSVSPEMIERLAQQSGADPVELARQVEAAHEGFYDAVMDRVGTLGVHDADLFGEFIEGDSRMAKQMQKAVRDMVTNNDPTGFDGLAQKFTQSLDMLDPESVTDALKASGIPSRRGNNGQILMSPPEHGEVSYREAVRMGLIKVSRA
ncbi:hypothetical protein E4L95_15895 [Paracoccus liaowanqingii]|uniref:Uncharacterized protein n=1 Tax=Paracoccus liaowanqingii TaxID=2560053 RepID=A0A4Z1CES7_9RHOB|nr:hypothetical protein [Paracoccus liaowanqingii]TGN53780.1 hypothetical protein E4L95_15895 [Paracoccus liaowanqingii]